jgi:hypothetical protein
MNEKLKKILQRVILAAVAIGALILYVVVKKRLLPRAAALEVLSRRYPLIDKDRFTQDDIDDMFVRYAEDVEKMTKELERKETEEIKVLFHEAFRRNE